jgi:hypothetical protein
VAQIGPNPCNHYYWEDGEDSYADFLLVNGYIVDAIEEKEEENGNAGLKMMDGAKMIDGVMQKMDELIKLCKLIVAGIVVVIGVIVYVVFAK